MRTLKYTLKRYFSYLNRQFTRINDYKIIGISVYFTLGLNDVLASFFHRKKTFQLNFVVEKSKLWQKCMFVIYSTKLAFKSELQGSHSVVSCLSPSCIDSVTRTTKSCLASSVKNSTNHHSWSWGPFKIKFRPFLEWHAYAHSQSKLIVHLKGYLFLYAFTVARHVSWLNRLQSANLPPLNPRSKSNLWSVNFNKSGFIIFAN